MNAIIGPCGNYNGPMCRNDVDIDLLLYRILIFDKFIIRSEALIDLAHIFNRIDPSIVFELFKNNLLSVYLNDIDFAFWNIVPKPLQLINNEYRYIFSPLIPRRTADHVFENAKKHFLKTCHRNQKTKNKIINLFSDNIEFLPVAKSNKIIQAVCDDYLYYKKLVHLSFISSYIKYGYNQSFSGDINFRIEKIGDNKYCLLCNHGLFSGVNFDAIEKIFNYSLNDLGLLNIHLTEMENFESVYGFSDSEAELFKVKNKLILERVGRSEDVDMLKRVIEISGLPRFSDNPDPHYLDVDKIIKIKDSEEFREFKFWLSGAGALTDVEVKDIIKSKKLKIFNCYQSTLGKVMRFLVFTGMGLEPKLILPAIILNALDTFLLDKILPKSGVVSFLNNTYPSIVSAK
jgi:hypothetical protein